MQTKEFNMRLIELLDSCENQSDRDSNLNEGLKEFLYYFTIGNEKIIIDFLYYFLKQKFPNIREITLNTLASKGNEYSDNTDRFINFHKGKLLCQDLFDTHELTSRKVLMILASKHVVWCLDYLDGKIAADNDKILEHFGDVMNYLIISYIAGEVLN